MKTTKSDLVFEPYDLIAPSLASNQNLFCAPLEKAKIYWGSVGFTSLGKLKITSLADSSLNEILAHIDTILPTFCTDPSARETFEVL